MRVSVHVFGHGGCCCSSLDRLLFSPLVRGNSSKSRPSYEVDKDSVMSGVLAWLDPDLCIVPNGEELVEVAVALEGEGVDNGLESFVTTTNRWPAPRENPPLHYAGDKGIFASAGNAAVSGIIQKKSDGSVAAADAAQGATLYFCELAYREGKGLFRVPLIPAIDRRTLMSWMNVAVNRFMIS